MATITAPTNEAFTDGVYSGICAREKALREFDGVVSLTEAGRIVATGMCPMCPDCTMTVSLYNP